MRIGAHSACGQFAKSRGEAECHAVSFAHRQLTLTGVCCDAVSRQNILTLPRAASLIDCCVCANSHSASLSRALFRVAPLLPRALARLTDVDLVSAFVRLSTAIAAPPPWRFRLRRSDFKSRTTFSSRALEAHFTPWGRLQMHNLAVLKTPTSCSPTRFMLSLARFSSRRSRE